MSIISGSAAISTTAAAGSPDFYDFPIGQSLMFDGTNDYLDWTPAGAGQNTWTFSFWMKLGSLTGTQCIYSSGVANAQGTIYMFSGNNHFSVMTQNSAGANRIINYSSNILRDTSAWYHIVVVGTGTGEFDISFYINGSLITGVTSSHNTTTGGNRINDNQIKRIGSEPSANYFDGYLAEINLLDGYVPTTGNGGIDSSTGYLKVLGETKNGVWTPKDPIGLTYGTNGFRLTFENDGTTNTISGNDFVDQSTNSNNWTATGF